MSRFFFAPELEAATRGLGTDLAAYRDAPRDRTVGTVLDCATGAPDSNAARSILELWQTYPLEVLGLSDDAAATSYGVSGAMLTRLLRNFLGRALNWPSWTVGVSRSGRMLFNRVLSPTVDMVVEALAEAGLPEVSRDSIAGILAAQRFHDGVLATPMSVWASHDADTYQTFEIKYDRSNVAPTTDSIRAEATERRSVPPRWLALLGRIWASNDIATAAWRREDLQVRGGLQVEDFAVCGVGAHFLSRGWGDIVYGESPIRYVGGVAAAAASHLVFDSRRSHYDLLQYAGYGITVYGLRREVGFIAGLPMLRGWVWQELLQSMLMQGEDSLWGLLQGDSRVDRVTIEALVGGTRTARFTQYCGVSLLARRSELIGDVATFDRAMLEALGVSADRIVPGDVILRARSSDSDLLSSEAAWANRQEMVPAWFYSATQDMSIRRAHIHDTIWHTARERLGCTPSEMPTEAPVTRARVRVRPPVVEEPLVPVSAEVSELEATVVVPDNSARFGIELEFHPGRATQRTYLTALRDALSPFGASDRVLGHGYMHSDGYTWDLKTDSSCGLELASPALRWEDWPMVEAAATALQQAGAIVTSNCGVHVHHEIHNHTPAALRRMLLTWYTFEDVLFDFVHPSRRTNRYCAGLKTFAPHWPLMRSLAEAATSASTISSLVRSIGRYRSLNLTHWWNSGRVEVRMHHGTLRPNLLRFWTAMTQQFIANTLRTTRAYRTLGRIAQDMQPTDQYEAFLRSFRNTPELVPSVQAAYRRYMAS